MIWCVCGFSVNMFGQLMFFCTPPMNLINIIGVSIKITETVINVTSNGTMLLKVAISSMTNLEMELRTTTCTLGYICLNG